MKIAFVINDMGVGGAEHLLQSLANYIVKKTEHEVFVILLEGRKNAYEFDSKIKVIKLKGSVLSRGPGKLLFMPLYAYELNRLLKKLKVDISLSFLVRANLVNAMSGFFDRKRHILISEHNTSIEQYRHKSRFMKKLIGRYYPKATKIITVSEGIKESLVNDFGISPEKIETIYNPIEVKEIKELSKKEVDISFAEKEFKIVTLGRLVLQKDHSTLLRSFAKVREKRKDAKLIIIGKGPEEQKLKTLAKNLGILDDIWFTGWVENPYSIMNKCDLFVLGSKFEGFGNVIVEAMACDLPVLSTDCPNGPREILSEGKFGMLVPVGEVGKIAKGIERFMEPQVKEKYIRASEKRAGDFDVSVIAPKYLEFLKRDKNN